MTSLKKITMETTSTDCSGMVASLVRRFGATTFCTAASPKVFFKLTIPLVFMAPWMAATEPFQADR